MTDSQTPKRTQAERSQQRRAQVIYEATRQFGQYGFRGATLAEIARAAGVTEPGLLHHFPSKVHLLMDVLAERDRANRERFDPAQNSTAGQLLEALQALVTHNETTPGLVQLFTVLVAESIDPDHPSHAFFVERYKTLRDQTVQRLKQAQERGEIRADLRPEDLTVMVFALMDGLQIQWLLDPDQVQMSQVFETFIQLVSVK